MALPALGAIGGIFARQATQVFADRMKTVVGKSLPRQLTGGVFGNTTVSNTIIGLDELNKRALLDPQKNYMWDMAFYDFGGASREKTNNLTFRVLSASIPSTQFEHIPRHIQNHTVQYIGKETSPKILRVTLWDAEDMYAYKFFDSWFKFLSSGDLKMKASSATFQRNISLRLVNSSNTLSNLNFLFSGCVPIEMTDIILSYTENDKVTFDVIIKFTDKRIVS
jgi:hypothetical protein